MSKPKVLIIVAIDSVINSRLQDNFKFQIQVLLSLIEANLKDQNFKNHYNNGSTLDPIIRYWKPFDLDCNNLYREVKDIINEEMLDVKELIFFRPNLINDSVDFEEFDHKDNMLIADNFLKIKDDFYEKEKINTISMRMDIPGNRAILSNNSILLDEDLKIKCVSI